jgi:DNA-binding transcriptional regulator YiaG
MPDRLRDMMHELAQEIARELAKILKAEKPEVPASIAPVVVPRLTPSNPKYLTQPDLARLFNVASRTIYNWRTNGTLPAARVLPEP